MPPKLRWPFRLIFGVFLLVLACSPAASACSCSSSPDLSMMDLVKASFERAGTVFIGVPRALHGESADDQDSDLVVFDVETVFKGPQTTKIAIHSGIGRKTATTCGYSFEVGTRYLVFADGFGQAVNFSIQLCGGYHVYGFTGPVDSPDNAVALRYLQNRALLPEDFLSPHEINRRATGTIYGTIRRSDGKPLGEKVSVFIWNDSKPPSDPSNPNPLEEDNPQFTAWVEDGRFAYDSLEPGTYWVSAVDESDDSFPWVGAFSSPSDPFAVGKINLIAGQDFRGADIILQEQKKYSIRGVIRSTDGTVTPHAEIEAQTPQAQSSQYLDEFQADAQGKFFIQAMPGGPVLLRAQENPKSPTIKVLYVTGNMENIEIVLKKDQSSPSK